MNSEITLEEIKRLFNYLEENKTNDNLQIIMTTEGCNDLYKLFIDFNKYQKILEERIDKAIEFIEDGDLLYLASKCSVIYRDNIEVVAIRDRLIELLDILKGSDKDEKE